MLGSGSRYHSLVPHTHMAGAWTAEIEPAEFKNPETVSPRALLPAGTHNPLLGPHIYTKFLKSYLLLMSRCSANGYRSWPSLDLSDNELAAPVISKMPR